jgi:acetoin utilization deacetylase AcuC-like enzyme
MSRPSDDDRVEALRRFLVGLARGDDANQLAVDIADLHVRHNTFPGEVLMELAADALATAGVERETRVAYQELLSTHLPEVEFRGKEHRRIQYAVLTAFAVHGGLEPDLLDEVTYWIEQYWQYALFAAVASVRACAEQSGTPLETFVAELAARHAIDIN